MQNILAIWQREIKSYFVSPVAYVVLVIFLLVCGIVFSFYLAEGVRESSQSMMQEQMGQGSQAIDVPALVAQRLFGIISVILLLLIPLLTMRLFSEEKKRGTIELLLTTPVSNFSAMMGKYLASLTFLLILFLANGVALSVLLFYGSDWKPILSGFLGMFLYGAALLALGIFVSTLTDNQIIAAVLAFGISLFFVFISALSYLFSFGKNVFDYLSITNHLDNFIMGVIDTSHVIYYVSFAFVGLYLTYLSLGSMRWKG
jgi:ABC-2 type transport system permease protein